MAVADIPLEYRGAILSLAYHAKVKLLAVGQMGDPDGRPCLTLWDPLAKKVVAIIEREASRHIWAVCFDYRGKYLLYSDNHSLFIYDIVSGEKRTLITDNGKIARIVSSTMVSRVAVSGKRVMVLDIDTEEVVWSLAGYEAQDDPACVEIFRNGRGVLVSGHNKATIEQIAVDSGAVIRTIAPAPTEVGGMSLGCNERVIVVSSRVPRGNFAWELEGGQRILPSVFNEQFGNSPSLCLHATERLLAMGALAGFVSLQPLDKIELAFHEKLHEGRVNQVIFGDDAKLFYSGGDDGTVKIIDLN